MKIALRSECLKGAELLSLLLNHTRSCSKQSNLSVQLVHLFHNFTKQLRTLIYHIQLSNAIMYHVGTLSFPYIVPDATEIIDLVLLQL